MNTTVPRAGLVWAALVAGAPALAAAPPPVQIFVNGAPLATVSWSPDLLVPGGYTTPQTLFSGATVNIGESFFAPTSNPGGSGWSFSYGLGFNVSGAAPATLTVIYDLPFAAAVAGSVNADSSLVGTLLDGTGAGVQLQAPAGGKVQTVTFVPGAGDNVGLSIGPSASGAASGNSGQQFAYGQFSASTSALAGSWSGMRVVAEFTLQPGSAALSLDGTVNITPVPEPETYALMLGGLLAVTMMMRRQRG